ncbi:hypothetical protein ACXYUI_33975, partial [Klebsiella pneumoniae]
LSFGALLGVIVGIFFSVRLSMASERLTHSHLFTAMTDRVADLTMITNAGILPVSATPKLIYSYFQSVLGTFV